MLHPSDIESVTGIPPGFTVAAIYYDDYNGLKVLSENNTEKKLNLSVCNEDGLLDFDKDLTTDCTHSIIKVIPQYELNYEKGAIRTPSLIKTTGTAPHGGAYNDHWNLGGNENDRPMWKRRGNPADDKIHWDGKRWCLRCIGFDRPAYVCNIDSPLPPKQGWLNEKEAGGVPTLDYESGYDPPKLTCLFLDTKGLAKYIHWPSCKT